ncbi:MAG: FxLD family lanthipeptide [Pseudonocardiaceae bacterium]
MTLVDDVEDIGGFDEAEFVLDLRVIEAAYPIAKLRCDTSDGCGSTCSGSACNSLADNPS